MKPLPFPKIDLHLHLDGSLSYPFLQKLAQENGMIMSDQAIRSAVTARPDCTSLKEYLDCFNLPLSLLQTEQALTLAAFDLISRLESQQLTYAEIRFAPQLHTQKNLTQQKAVEAVLNGVEKARRQNFRIQTGILLCMFVTGTYPENRETAELAAAYKGKGVVGLDLAGAEGAVPMAQFQPLFQMAYQAALPFTIHAGECGDYENINQAVAFGARRIGHGCAARFSEACMELLRKEQIVLEMCPVSNLQTKAVASLAEHPIRLFFEHGIPVTVNTDNMTVSDTSLEKEYRLLRDQLHFTEAELKVLSETARKAAFGLQPS
ncbi:MAG: adenosine deaminase [Candidatus Limivivens sp.]|nr:adenosine deaminase [Candidatus Limivivens sp.]